MQPATTPSRSIVIIGGTWSGGHHALANRGLLGHGETVLTASDGT